MEFTIVPWVDIGMAFSMGVIGSIHCVGMCGGLLAALSMGRRGTWWPGLFFYHAGRIITYSILGLLGGLLTQHVTLTARFQTGLSIIAGSLIILFALQIGGWTREYFGAASRFFMPPSLLRRINEGNSISAWWGTGLLNGLLPCGMVYAALALAVNRADPYYGLLTMLAFGLGTVPAMTAFWGLLRTLLPSFRGRLLKWGAVLLVLFGIFTIVRGVMPVHHHTHGVTEGDGAGMEKMSEEPHRHH